MTGIQYSGLQRARILAVGAIDVTHRDGIGATSWPTSDKMFAGPWNDRKKLKGFSVAPGHYFQILILVERTRVGQSGTLNGERLHYTGSNPIDYYSDDHLHFKMAAGRCF